MDCEYVLFYRTGPKKSDEFHHKFHAATLEDAVGTAREIIKHHQRENVAEFPFAPVAVKGELYRQMLELDGAEFIKKQPLTPLTPREFS